MSVVFKFYKMIVYFYFNELYCDKEEEDCIVFMISLFEIERFYCILVFYIIKIYIYVDNLLYLK